MPRIRAGGGVTVDTSATAAPRPVNAKAAAAPRPVKAKAAAAPRPAKAKAKAAAALQPVKAKAAAAPRPTKVEDDDDDCGDIGTVKMTLNRFCMDDHRQQLVARVQTLVATINQAVAEAYLFANFHVTRCLSDPAFPVSELPQLDRNFYYRCLLAVSESNVRDNTLSAELKATRDAFDALRPDNYVKANVKLYGQALADASIQMATMASNSVWANVDRVIIKYLRVRHLELRSYWTTIVTAVLKLPTLSLNEVFKNRAGPRSADAKMVADRLRAWLPLTNGRQFKTQAHLPLRLLHTVLADLQAFRSAPVPVPASESKRGRTQKHVPKLFHLLPRKSGFTVSYVPMSTMTFMKLLSLGPTPLEQIQGDGRNADHVGLWRKYFNVKAVETSKLRFDHRILTDGKGVSIQRVGRSAAHVDDGESERGGYPVDADAAACRATLADTERSISVGVDPGMTDIATAQFSNGQVASFSSARFSQEAGYNTSKHRVTKWNAETEAQVAAIPTSKVSSVAELEDHIRGYLAVLPQLLKHRAEKGYRSMRFFRYVGKQKTIEKVCDMIAPRDKAVVVGFGNWANNGTGISRRCSGPIKEIRKRLAARDNVLFKNVDERKTSVTCSCCHQRLVNMAGVKSVRWRWSAEAGVRVKAEVLMSKVHKVLHCRDSVKSASNGSARCGTTWNRDVNAAKNLNMLLLKWVYGEARPEAFRATVTQPKNTVSREAGTNRQTHRPSRSCGGGSAAAEPVILATSSRNTE